MGKVRKSKDHHKDKWFNLFYVSDESPSRLMRSSDKSCVGWKTDSGYWQTEVFGKPVKVHRIVYELHNGDLNDQMVVDHIDRNPSNNDPKNLRQITYAENCRNKKLSKNNKTGLNGIQEVHVFIATWIDNKTGNQHSKKFSVNRFGYEVARQMAIDYRENKIKELNGLGHNYHETHGKE